MTHPPAIKHCRVCGVRYAHVKLIALGVWRVVCINCSAESREHATKANAIQEWNRRL